MTDLSLNAVASYDWDAFLVPFISAPSVRSIFLIDPSPEQVEFALAHCDFVVVRIFDGFNEHQGGKNPNFEKTVLENHLPQEFVTVLDSRGFGRFKGNTKLRFLVSWNELASKRGDAERLQNNLMASVGREMIQNGYGVGLGGWAADKSFYQDDISAGHWDSIIELCLEFPDFTDIDAHEYEVGPTAGQFLKSYPDGYPDSLLNPDAIVPANFGTIAYRRAEGDIDRNYHIGRIAWVLDYAQQKYGKVPTFYRGECVHDIKQDGSLKDFINDIIIPRYGEPRGINSLQGWYSHLAGTNLSIEAYNDRLIWDFDWLMKNSGGAKSNFVFAHHPNSEWVLYNTRNPERLSVVNWIATHESDAPSPPENPLNNVPESAYSPHNITTNGSFNVRIRAYPSLNSRILGFIAPDRVTLADLAPDYRASNSDDNWVWIPIRVTTEIWGWVASELISFSPVDECAKCRAEIERLKTIINNAQSVLDSA